MSNAQLAYAGDEAAVRGLAADALHPQSPALVAALAALDAYPQPNEATALIVAKCRALAVGYDARYGHEAYYTPVAVEQMYLSPIVNPDTNAKSRTFQVGGKLDLLYQRNGHLGVFDHKTTSQDILDPDGTFWRQLTIEGQVSHYMLLMWLCGQKCDEAVWDVMRKPTISPKKITKAERTAAVANREYFDRPLSPATLQALQAEERETLEMYEARLVHDCVKERPQYYFQRRVVPRLDAELIEYARELWGHGQEILHARKTNRHARNSGACMLYGTPCKFLGICSGHDTPDSDKWARKAQVHAELELDGDGRDVITNSRIRCFQTCRRKHYYDFEMGIVRHDEEDREALLFGTIWHLALEAWWSTFLPKEPINGNRCESPATEVGNRPAIGNPAEADGCYF